MTNHPNRNRSKQQQPTHTPGPWRYEDYKETPHVMGPAGPIAEIYGADKPHSTDANARLIAAAPELLAALKMFAAWEDGTHETSPHQQHDNAMSAARAVIAKAEGR